MVFKKSDIIVHAAMLFLICFANEASKNFNAINDTVVDETELEESIFNEVKAPIVGLPTDELPFISAVDIRLIANPKAFVLPNIMLP